MKRFFFSGAAVDEPDKQGRIAVPADAVTPCGPRPGRGRRGRLRPPRDLGSQLLGEANAAGRRECRGCCPTPRVHRRPVTFRCWPRRCGASSRSSGQTVVDATFGAGGHAGCSPTTSRARPTDRDRPRLERQAVLRAAARHLRASRHGCCEGISRGCSTGWPRTASPRTSCSRPGRVEHAARPARARLLVRDRRAARHADGSLAGHCRPRPRQARRPSRSWRRFSAGTARNGLPGRSPARSPGEEHRSSGPVSSSRP